MNIATQYAKALFSAKSPTLASFKDALKRRGHEKLLPQIYREYEKLALGRKRREQYTAVTPEREQTRVLFELYKKLVN
jgi:hypothetical protein